MFILAIRSVSCPEWITTEVQDSTFVVKSPRNDTGAVRKGNIVLSSGDVTTTITVRQMIKCTHITPETDAVELGKEGGTKTVAINTDGFLHVTAPEDFTVSYAGGVLTVSANANDGYRRSGEIALKADEYSATIAVSQKGNVCPRCNGTGKVKCTKCGGKGEYWSEAYIAFIGCSKCGGKGSVGALNDGFLRGSGMMTCPECGGTGH